MRYTKENLEKKKESYNLEPKNLLENSSIDKRKNLIGINKEYIQNNMTKPKIRYYNNNEKNSIKKNKSCPKLNIIEKNTINDKIDNDNYKYSDLYIDNNYDSYSSKNENNQLNHIHLTKGRYMPDSSFNSQRRDYISKNPGFNYEYNNNIFTRIVPKFDYNDNNKIIPKNTNNIYCKSKTPNKLNYNKKKRIMISIFIMIHLFLNSKLHLIIVNTLMSL
jgi:hypothetical protein